MSSADTVGDGAEVVLVGHTSTAWYAGAQNEPVDARPRPGGDPSRFARRRALDEVAGRRTARRRRHRRAVPARGPEVNAIAEYADHLRRETVGDTITWVHNRNINYTNVCTFKCRFCGFSKGPLSLNLRGTPYLLTLDDIAERAAEAEALGATEVTLQGGIHPDFDGDYYIDVTRAVREAAPTIHVHGFTALEVTEGAKRLGEPPHLPRPAQGGRAVVAAGHRSGDPRRPGPRDPLPRQDQHRRVARLPPPPHTTSASTPT